MHRLLRMTLPVKRPISPSSTASMTPSSSSSLYKRAISSETSPSQKRAKTTTPTSPASSIINKITSTIAAPQSQKDLAVWSPSPLLGVGAPAKYQQRVRYIDALIKAYTDHNIPLPKATAVKKEFEIASKSSNITYGPNMKICIRDARLNKEPEVVEKNSTRMSRKEQYDAVKALIHPIDILKRSDYITEIPELGDDWKDPITGTCNRCQGEFQFKDISVVNKCQFHERKKTFHNSNRYWVCCEQVVGETQGCKTADHHVFKAADGRSMQNLIPFVKTPEVKKRELHQNMVGLDCEMGYTTKGLELIRLTVLDFYSGKSLFDQIIKPYGEILDLNTQWSGVSDVPEDSLTLDELQKLLFNSIIDKDTIIVGHGLENDLNALRLVHHNVVDTSILYPRGIDGKFALKELSFKLLDRKIQTGEHSSEEDSLAAIDIVKARINKK